MMKNSLVRLSIRNTQSGTFATGNQGLSGSKNPFNGAIYANYTSPLVKKDVYRNTTLVYKPLRRHVFRIKAKTACELRFFEIQKNWMANQKFAEPRLMLSLSSDTFDHCGSVVPKDEYEVQKMTQYMTSMKTSEDARLAANKQWQKFYFTCQAHNYVGVYEDASLHNASLYTEEEFTSWAWFFMMWGLSIGVSCTGFWWWWKFGQAPEYLEVK